MKDDRNPQREPDGADRVLRRFVGLQQLSAALAATVDLARVAEELVRAGTALVGAREGAVYRIEGDELRLFRCSPGSAEILEALGPVPLDGPAPLALVARRREELCLEEPEAIDERFPEVAHVRARIGVGSWFGLPLVAGDRVQGVLGFGYAEGVSFDATDRALMRSLAAQCAQAFERCRLFAAEVAQREEAERAALRMRREAERAGEAGALLDALFEATPVGLVFHDRELRVARMNAALGEMIGQAPDACVGLRVGEIPGMTNAAELHAWLAEGLAASAPIHGREVASTGRDGQPRKLLCSFFPVDHGARLGVAAAVRDVTLDRRAEEFRRHVLGIVGHDLRTPLAAIELSASALLRRQTPSGRDAAALGRILSSGRRMDAIIRDLLDYARAASGAGVPVAARDADLAELCRGVVDEARAAHPGRELFVEGAGDPAGVWDPDRLGQALGNLVGNALEHGRPDRPVTVRWSGGDGAVEVEVRNEGEPIPPELLDRIFEPFRGGARTRQAGGGLGLGLFIARELVRAHGGTLEARSGAEATSFAMRLPRRTAT